MGNTFQILDPWLDIPVKKALPQCETEVTNSRKTNVQCKNKASVTICKKNYCRAHAGSVLLDMIASGEYRLEPNQAGVT